MWFRNIMDLFKAYRKLGFKNMQLVLNGKLNLIGDPEPKYWIANNDNEVKS